MGCTGKKTLQKEERVKGKGNFHRLKEVTEKASKAILRGGQLDPTMSVKKEKD